MEVSKFKQISPFESSDSEGNSQRMSKGVSRLNGGDLSGAQLGKEEVQGISKTYSSREQDNVSDSISDAPESVEAKGEDKLFEMQEFMQGARTILTGQSIICFISQCFCCSILFMAIMRDSAIELLTYPSTQVVLLRFVCSIGLHSFLHSDLNNGLHNMKFVINHSERFKSLFMAFNAGFFQVVSSLLIETTNLLIILSSTTEFDVVLNFMALKVIADFPSFFVIGVERNLINDFVKKSDYEHLYRISRTTSDQTVAMYHHFGDLINSHPAFVTQDSILVDFENQWAKKVMRKIYQTLRLFHVVLWYYFFPSLTLILSFGLPLYLNTRH